MRALALPLSRVRGAVTRASALALFAGGAFVAGLVLRAFYVLDAHHPRHQVFSDAASFVDIARRLLSDAGAQSIKDTIWQPGMPAVLSLLIARDPTFGSAALLSLVASALVPLFVAHATYLVAGTRTALVALALASLHYGFVHYAGFLLSEQLFQFTVTLALWASVLSLSALDARLEAPRARREALVLAAYGAAAGACWALATAFRPNALPVFALVACVLGLRWLRQRERRRLPFVLGAVLAVVLGLMPLAARCTLLSQKFCPGSNNIAMNMVLGQAGEVKGLWFKSEARPELASGWVPPALLAHGYTESGEVPFSIYDTRAALAWVGQRFVSEPKAFVVRALGNALDLFRLEYWPGAYGSVPRRVVAVAQQLFWLLVLAPGLVGVVAALGRQWRRPRSSAASFVCLVPPALGLVAAGSLGEPRYRTAFDAVFVLFAAGLYVGAAPGARRYLSPERLRGVAPALTLAASFAALSLLVIALVSHPASRLAERLFRDEPPSVVASRREHGFVRDFGAPKAPGDGWDSPGSHRFRCNPRCAELVVALPTPAAAEAIELSLDHNDAYQVTLYAGADVVFRRQIVPARSGTGLRLERLAAESQSDANDGGALGDAVGVLPLYGDGRYALGHVRVIER